MNSKQRTLRTREGRRSPRIDDSIWTLGGVSSVDSVSSRRISYRRDIILKFGRVNSVDSVFA
jgi:hypothetical protein